MNQLEHLKKLIAEAEADAEKFFGKGNNVAGTRLRKKLQEIKVEAQRLRGAVTEAKEDAKKL